MDVLNFEAYERVILSAYLLSVGSEIFMDKF